jgi:ABC-2 type transport system permease protein
MSTNAQTSTESFTDSITMVRRNLLHMLRYPSVTVFLVGIPVILLLLFVYVFGGTLGAGLSASGDRGTYVEFVLPGILLLTVASGGQGTAISVAMDMTQGIISRFRTMAISRTAVLTGHVGGSVIQAMISIAAVVGVAVLMGFQATAGLAEWLVAIGALAAIALSITWLSVAFGLVAKSVESASNIPMFLVLLPFLGSGFVPADSMPGPMQWFAEYQPFTPFIDTVRSLLTGTPMGNSGLLTVIWCAVIGLGGYLWARYLYGRPPRLILAQ